MLHIIIQRVYLLTLLFLAIGTHLGAQDSRVRTLRILDQDNHDPIEAAYIILSPTSAVMTDTKGRATLPRNLSPTANILIRCVGYREHKISVAKVLKSKGETYTICLLPDQESLEEVLVEAERRTTSVNAVSTKISSAEIDRSIGKSLAALLEGVSGVSTIQTGANTAKPVIHGMHGNRILIVNNGVRQSGQQWGEGHAPEVDMSSSGAIHVVKGAESVRYGAEAMGGTIVMDQKALPYRRESLSGSINTLYGSNGRRGVAALSLEGVLPKLEDWAWRLQGTYNTSGDKHTAHYMLNNTGSRGNNLTASVGYDHARLRIEAFYSRYEEEAATLRSAQLGNVELLRERIEQGRPPQEVITPFARTIDYPREHVIHHTATAKASYRSRHWGTLYYQFSHQWDDRREYRIRRNNNSHIPEVALNLTSRQHQARWELGYGLWQTELGGQHLYTNNYSTPGNGVVPLIPNYVDQSWGVYGLQKFHHRAWDAEVGMRLDGQKTKAAGYNYFGQAYGGERKFLNLTYSLGGRYKPNDRWSVTSNFGAAWRAPHVHELFSNGVEHGSGAYIVGQERLDSEQSYKWITSLVYRTPWLHISLDGYLQWVKNFIYDEPQRGEYFTVISGAYPVFRYKQTEAFFRGVDLDLQLEPIKGLSYRLTTALIWANEQGTGSFLPFIPPLRIDHQIAWSHSISRQLQSELSLGHRFVAKQTRFDPNKDLISFTPDAYHLLSAEAALEWRLAGRQSLRLFIAGDNLLNSEYKEYTNRARYYSHDLGRDLRCSVAWRF